MSKPPPENRHDTLEDLKLRLNAVQVSVNESIPLTDVINPVVFELTNAYFRLSMDYDSETKDQLTKNEFMERVEYTEDLIKRAEEMCRKRWI